ncbi:MAG: PH domain-containing protein [Bacteroidota bacterium]
MERLHASIQTVWSIKLGLVWAVLLVAALAYELSHLFVDERTLPLGVLAGLVLVMGLSISLGLPRLRYRTWRYDLRPEELYLEYGILNRVRTIVPLRRIQHLDVSQDVLEREFELGKLIVHTAGSRSSDVVLPGLQYDHAEQLRDEVRTYVLRDTTPDAV